MPLVMPYKIWTMYLYLYRYLDLLIILMIRTWRPFPLSTKSGSNGGGHVGTGGGGIDTLFCPDWTPIPSFADGIFLSSFGHQSNWTLQQQFNHPKSMFVFIASIISNVVWKGMPQGTTNAWLIISNKFVDG